MFKPPFIAFESSAGAGAIPFPILWIECLEVSRFVVTCNWEAFRGNCWDTLELFRFEERYL